MSKNRLNNSSFNRQKEVLNFLRSDLPEIFSEGKIDCKKLKQTLGEKVEDNNERYGLNWAGKSGDLGFDFSKEKTTKYFLITLLFVENKRSIEKLIKKLHSNLRKKYKIKSGVLHASKEESITCLRFCKKIVEKDCKIMTIYLNKKRVYTRLQNEKAVLYNYVVNILLDRIVMKNFVNKGESIEFIASRRETSKFLNLNFKNYLENQIRSNHKIPIRVKIKTPAEEKCLQAVDFVSWSIFRKYEYGDNKYYNIIRKLIVEENPLFS